MLLVQQGFGEYVGGLLRISDLQGWAQSPEARAARP